MPEATTFAIHNKELRDQKFDYCSEGPRKKVWDQVKNINSEGVKGKEMLDIEEERTIKKEIIAVRQPSQSPRPKQ